MISSKWSCCEGFLPSADGEGDGLPLGVRDCAGWRGEAEGAGGNSAQWSVIRVKGDVAMCGQARVESRRETVQLVLGGQSRRWGAVSTPPAGGNTPERWEGGLAKTRLT